MTENPPIKIFFKKKKKDKKDFDLFFVYRFSDSLNCPAPVCCCLRASEQEIPFDLTR
jgi:hypothetical protein